MNQYIRDFRLDEFKSVIIDNDFLWENDINRKNWFSIFHCNVRSLNKNFDEMVIMLRQFKRQNFDIIVCTETWKVHDLNFFKIEGYFTVYNEGDVNQNDGVVVYIKDSYRDKLNYEINNLGQIKVINLKLKIRGQRIIIIAVYRPHATCPHEFNFNLKNYLETNTNETENIYFLVGDTNIDIQSNKDFCHNYLNVLSELGFKSLINSYTRVHNGSKSCIDHIFVKNKKCSEYKSFIINIDITDHYPIIALMEIQKDLSSTPKIKKVIQIDETKLKNILKNENWNEVYNTNDLDIATNKFVQKIRKATEKASKDVNIKLYTKKRHQWISNGLIKSAQTKHNLYKIYKYNPNPENEHKYKVFKNKLNRLIKQTKSNFFKNEIKKNEKDSKSLWKVVNNYTNSQKEQTPINIIKVGENTITDKNEIANCFNTYFTEVGEKLANDISKPTTSVVTRNIIENSIFFHATDETEVANIIGELKANKAPGLDLITTKTLKILANDIKKPLTYLINKIFELGHFPRSLKKGLIKPLFKKGDPTQVSNYRPITLISNIAKIVEKIIKKRIVAYLDKYHLISEKQYGFKQGVSTEDAILHLTTNIYTNLDENNVVLCVFLDLAKAFDTVDHKKMIDILEDLGFRGIALSLFKTYLSNRTQCVQVDDIISTEQQIKFGVPQGTVLGPILFSIYINGLLKMKSNGNISSFADDTVIQYSAKTWKEVKEKSETDLQKIKIWFDEMYLTINFEKTKYIPFSCNKSKIPHYKNIEIQINKQTFKINEVNHIKYLGITIDRFLKWDIHINILVKKLRQILFKFKQLKKILDIGHLKIIYYSIVESHIQYGIIGWGGAYRNHIKQLEVIQKRFLKIMYSKTHLYPSDLLYSETKIKDITQIYCYKCSIMQHKKRRCLPIIQHEHNTRYKQEKKTGGIKTNKTLGQRSFSFIAPRIYRELPENIRQLDNYKQFKKRLKKWLEITPRKKFNTYF